jgi:hypothetical protein
MSGLWEGKTTYEIVMRAGTGLGRHPSSREVTGRVGPAACHAAFELSVGLE